MRNPRNMRIFSSQSATAAAFRERDAQPAQHAHLFQSVGELSGLGERDAQPAQHFKSGDVPLDVEIRGSALPALSR
jgi:hypothetical protein